MTSRTKASAKRRRSPRYKDVYTMSRSIAANRPNQIGVSEFQDAELYAIGLVAIQWAHLEHLLLFDTAKMANRAKFRELPSDAVSMSFTRRLRAWRLTVEATVKSKPKREKLLALGHRIGSLEGDRHKIIHGLWQWSTADPVKLRAHSFRPRVAFQDNGYSADRIFKIADRIGAVNFELAYRDYPSGKKKQDAWFQRQLLAGAREAGFAYVSRRFLLQLSGKALPSLWRTVAIPPENMPPLPPSPQSPPEAETR